MCYNERMIEKAKKEDLSQIYNISNYFFDWKISQLEECVLDESMIFLVEKNENEVVGFLIAQNLLDSVNLLLIATKKQCQNKGIASNLLSQLEKIVTKKNISKIWLEVKDSNLCAIKFYEKHNFKFLTRRKRYYSSGEDALIYEKNAF